MKKLLPLFAVICVLLASCSFPVPENEKTTVACLDFVSFDFARAVCGERADARLIIPSDADSHSHELTLSESALLMSADVVIYGGGENDLTVTRAVEASGKDIKVIRLIDCVELLCADDDEEHDHEHEHDHDHDHDVHVWTSPVNAMLICDRICSALSETDVDGKDVYAENCAAYKARLSGLDADLEAFFSTARSKTLIVADVFPFRYFTSRYSLDYVAAFGGCAEGDIAPSLTRLAKLKDALSETGTDAVFYTEFSSRLTAECVSEETGCRIFLLRSCHRVERDRFESGVTYIDLMYENLETLKEALG